MFFTLWNKYHECFNSVLIFTLQVLILCKKVWGLRPGARGNEFWYTLKFDKEHVLYRKIFETQANQAVNKDLNGELPHLR